MSRLTQLLKRALLAELAVFGLVGIVCLVGDVVFFNLLAFGLGLTPVLAKSISLVITGVMALRSACFSTTRPSCRPLARAVRT